MLSVTKKLVGQRLAHLFVWGLAWSQGWATASVALGADDAAKKIEISPTPAKASIPQVAPALPAVSAPPAAVPVLDPNRDLNDGVCLDNPAIAPDMSRAETYKDMPFQPGEEMRYVLKYGMLKVHVGYGYLRVLAPTRYSLTTGKKEGQAIQDTRWHRVFAAEAYTGDWYKMIFAGHDKLQSFSRPWDFGVTKFYISQNEEKPFVRKFHAEKWLDFDHVRCSVHEKQIDHKKKKESASDHFLQPSAIDAMGAVYKLRTIAWEVGRTERLMIYTSEKNWWLEATPEKKENVKTPLGEFPAYKIKLKTYLGKELQQRGKLYTWIAAEHPSKPMLRIEGEVTFGSVVLELDRLTAGTPL